MKQQKTVWRLGLCLTALAAVTAYYYTRVYLDWNVPLYALAMAAVFSEGAAAFALLAKAKGKPKKRALLSALPGGAAAAGGVFALSFVINVLIFHEQGNKQAAAATAVFGFLFALAGVIRLKTLTKTRFLWKPLVGAVLSLTVFAAGVAGSLPSDFFIPARYGPAALRRAAAAELSSAEGKIYASEKLRQEDGTLTVAFIGGSLTEGRITYRRGKPRSTNVWTDDVLRMLAEKYPHKTLRAINAGKGGTNSEYGAERFGYDVEPYAPDLLFIEFSVNDCGALSCEKDAAGAARTQLYLEYMIRRCLQMRKEPVIVYLQSPYPTQTDTTLFRQWREGADLKAALCGHYGIPVVDVYDALHRQYEGSGGALPLEDWLDENGWYRRTEGGGLDVHPSAEGYRAVFSAAVLDALHNRWDELIRQPEHAPVYCKGETAYLNGSYSYVECADPRLTRSGGWRIVRNRLAQRLACSADAIPDRFLEYPHFMNGIAQVKGRPGAFLTYETDADELGMAVVSSQNGLTASVWIKTDGTEEKRGELRCGSVYGDMEFPAGTVTLPGDGQPHTLTIRIDDPDAGADLFRFGYLIEFRYGKD